jgi:hypothetical protein
MTFGNSDTVQTIETGQPKVGAPEPKRRGRQPQVAGKAVTPPVDDELDRVVDAAVELDETPALSESALRPSASPAEDPVRLYLKEIGKVSLLKAEEEVAIGQRIEIGQMPQAEQHVPDRRAIAHAGSPEGTTALRPGGLVSAGVMARTGGPLTAPSRVPARP